MTLKRCYNIAVVTVIGSTLMWDMMNRDKPIWGSAGYSPNIKK